MKSVLKGDCIFFKQLYSKIFLTFKLFFLLDPSEREKERKKGKTWDEKNQNTFTDVLNKEKHNSAMVF